MTLPQQPVPFILNFCNQFKNTSFNASCMAHTPLFVKSVPTQVSLEMTGQTFWHARQLSTLPPPILLTTLGKSPATMFTGPQFNLLAHPWEIFPHEF